MEHIWYLGATGRRDIVEREVPAFISEMFGYPVLIYFDFNISSFIKYSDKHLRLFQEIIEIMQPVPAFIQEKTEVIQMDGNKKTYTKMKDPRPTEQLENWRVKFPYKKLPVIEVMI